MRGESWHCHASNQARDLPNTTQMGRYKCIKLSEHRLQVIPGVRYAGNPDRLSLLA